MVERVIMMAVTTKTAGPRVGAPLGSIKAIIALVAGVEQGYIDMDIVRERTCTALRT